MSDQFDNQRDENPFNNFSNDDNFEDYRDSDIDSTFGDGRTRKIAPEEIPDDDDIVPGTPPRELLMRDIPMTPLGQVMRGRPQTPTAPARRAVPFRRAALYDDWDINLLNQITALPRANLMYAFNADDAPSESQ